LNAKRRNQIDFGVLFYNIFKNKKNMQSLYTKGFELIYDEMYKTFINYNEEFSFYSEIIKNYNKNNLLEIGCGSGNLAKLFIESSINYIGLDLSNDMIKLSKSKNPTGNFVQGNITGFNLERKVDSAIITGRTSSYLLSNKDVYSALNSIHTNLEDDGILSFDFIDASRFFKEIKNSKKYHHQAIINTETYYRDSCMKPNKNLDNFMFNWDAAYYKKENAQNINIIEDSSIVRAFTKNEWELFLELSGFKLLEFIDRKSYAFDTYVIIAQKKT
jgi:SAM-dependent methyltransferase